MPPEATSFLNSGFCIPSSFVIRISSLFLLLDQIGELVEEVGGIMRAGRGFGMILHAKDRQFFYRLVRAAMAELQFERRSPESEAENLMAETNPENRLLTHQIVHRLMRVGQRSWIARTVGKKNSIGIEREHFLCGSGCRDNSNAEAFLA